MNRREVLKLVAMGGAGAASMPLWGSRLVEVALAQAHGSAHGAATAWTPAVFSPHQDETVATLCELIIPQTDTAGAKAARVDRFIDAVLADADAPEREEFLRGLASVDSRSRELHGRDFVALRPEEQTALLAALGDGPFFRSLKTLTITGYYTSREGMLEELGDDGRMFFADYVGCTHPEHKDA